MMPVFPFHSTIFVGHAKQIFPNKFPSGVSKNPLAIDTNNIGDTLSVISIDWLAIEKRQHRFCQD